MNGSAALSVPIPAPGLDDVVSLPKSSDTHKSPLMEKAAAADGGIPAAVDDLEQGLDGLASQWGRMSPKRDVEGGSFAFKPDQPCSVGGMEQPPEVFLLGTVRAVEDFNPRAIEKAMMGAWSPRKLMERGGRHGDEGGGIGMGCMLDDGGGRQGAGGPTNCVQLSLIRKDNWMLANLMVVRPIVRKVLVMVIWFWYLVASNLVLGGMMHMLVWIAWWKWRIKIIGGLFEAREEKGGNPFRFQD